MRHRKPTRPTRKPGRPTPPARTVELDILELGGRGDGVARLGDDTVFVPFTVPGDKVLARVEGKRGDGLVAALIEVITPGPGRAEPPCEHYGRCGGCTLQHVDDALYEEWKRGLLVSALSRQGLGGVPVAPLVRVPPGSRRRATFAFSRKRGGEVQLGFNGRGSHQVVDLVRCPLVESSLATILPPLRSILAQLVADGEDGDVVVAATENGLDVLIEAEARLDLFDRERLAAFAETHDLARLSWRKPGGGFAEPIARRRPALVRFGSVAVEPPPGGFLQPTKGGELAIAELVTGAVGELAPVADLFAGCGSFTFPLAALGRVVHAVEGEQLPAQALEAAAHREGLAVTAEARDLSRRPLLAQELAKFKAVVFDPPRAGAPAQTEEIAKSALKLVVAVSCNPGTLARDLRTLVDAGFTVEAVTPIDQFPWSSHLEAVAVLRRG